MDVTTVSGSPQPGAAEQMRRTSEGMEAPKHHANSEPPEIAGPTKPLPLTEQLMTVKGLLRDSGQESPDEPGVLKFNTPAADVMAKFAIHEATNHVIVTMYQRETGEVIKEFPPRQVLDVMAALTGRGLAIDVSS